MTDPFFTEIEDPRERACVEALWHIRWPPSVKPSTVIDRGETAREVMDMLHEARRFLAMKDAVERLGAEDDR